MEMLSEINERMKDDFARPNIRNASFIQKNTIYNINLKN
jgi:hypothetical protein